MLLGAALTGCAAAGGTSASGEAAPALKTPLGNYLAGRFAYGQNDTAAAATYFAQALTGDPGNQALLQRVLSAELVEGRMADAIPYAQKQITTDPHAPLARLLLASAALRDKDYALARRNVEALETSGLSGLMRPMLLAWTEAGAGNREAALQALKKLEPQSGFSAFRTFHSALIEDFFGRPDEAEAQYKTAMDSGARNATRLVLAYGSMLTRAGRFDDAEALLASYLKRIEGNPVIEQALAAVRRRKAIPPPVAGPAAGAAEAFLGAGSALTRESSREAALVYGRLAAYLKPDLAAAYMLLAEVFDSEGRYEQAISMYRAVPGGSPYHREAQIRVAGDLDRLDQTDAAVDRLREMAEARPDDTDALVAAAEILRGRERYEEAAELYGKAVQRTGKLEPEDWSLLYAQGIALERSKRWAEAEKSFLKALELQPDQPLVLNYLGYSWVEQGTNLTRAFKMIESAVEQRPDDGYVVDSLGWAHYKRGEYKPAVRYLERAVDLRPEDPVINEHLGDAYWQVGRRLEARFQWHHALALGATEDRVPKIERKLESGMPASDSGHDGK